MMVGIIGKGKMGRDIFNYLFQYNHKLVLICRKSEDIDEIKYSVQKQLSKMLKRGYMDADSYEAKMQSFYISNELADLKDCDLVIESVYEDGLIKQDLFMRIESIVREDCILATNTSSFPLSQIFEKCFKRDRCLGMHFFFPVKITNVVEINKSGYTDEFFVNKVKAFLSSVEKEYLELNEEVNLIITKLYTLIIAEIYNIYEEGNLHVEEIEKVIKENFFTFGAFEIIDSTGINIFFKCLENYVNDRYERSFKLVHDKCEKLLNEGYSGGANNKGMYAYELENPREINEISELDKKQYKLDMILRLHSLLINEMFHVCKKGNADIHAINKAIQEVFGLTEDSLATLGRIGSEKVANYLEINYAKYKNDIYKPEDLYQEIYGGKI